ncbi:MAG TPA: hypothetical protein ENJ56_03435 [Anaerolineae bacterium]|nr:hypothetical protein [Anaerolineae bacterium]
MARKKEIDACIRQAVDFLATQQLPSGEFVTYRARDAAMTVEVSADSSVFPTALIGHSLQFIPQAAPMLDRAADFLLAAMERGGIWRYWTKQHEHHHVIPPDMDDIVCISALLRDLNRPIPDNIPLILANRNRDGLFYTWFFPRLSTWQHPTLWSILLCESNLRPSRSMFWRINESGKNDVDCVVNANLLFYLGQRRETEPVIDWLIEIIDQGQEACCDKWHLNRFTFYYMLSRCFAAGVTRLEAAREEIIGRIEQATHPDGSIGTTILETALAVCALHNFNVTTNNLSKAVDAICNAQQIDGSWPRHVMYYGGPAKYWGWGSEALTTAYCLEAIR